MQMGFKPQVLDNVVEIDQILSDANVDPVSSNENSQEAVPKIKKSKSLFNIKNIKNFFSTRPTEVQVPLETQNGMPIPNSTEKTLKKAFSQIFRIK
jgi:hypothetical protein